VPVAVKRECKRGRGWVLIKARKVRIFEERKPRKNSAESQRIRER